MSIFFNIATITFAGFCFNTNCPSLPGHHKGGEEEGVSIPLPHPPSIKILYGSL
jgi:hypothetical protein